LHKEKQKPLRKAARPLSEPSRAVTVLQDSRLISRKSTMAPRTLVNITVPRLRTDSWFNRAGAYRSPPKRTGWVS